MRKRLIEVEREIKRLEKERTEIKHQEARERLRAIFGKIPRDYNASDEEPLAMVARVYVKRGYGFNGDHLPDEEWIRKWKEFDPTLTAKGAIEIANDYIADGCGISG